MTRTNRNANIEMVRILAMLMIVSIHYWVFAFPISSQPPFSIPFILGTLGGSISCISVNIYVLISAYFLSASKFKFSRITELWSQVWFYSVLIFVLVVVFDHSRLTPLNALSNLTPILSRQYWFATVFIALLFLAPFLNKLLDLITKEQFKYLIGVLIVITVVLPTLMVFSSGAYYGHGTDITWFVVLYLMGAYIRRYCDFDKIREHDGRLKIETVCFCLLPAVVAFSISLIRYKMTGNSECPPIFLKYNSLFVLPGSIALFLFFATRKPLGNKATNIINTLAVGSFSVYLISDHRVFRDYMWSFVVSHTHTESCIMVVEYLVTIIAIYLICFALDLIYQKFLKKDHIMVLLKKIFGTRLERLENSINN